MMKKRALANRLKNIQSFIAMDVLREANALDRTLPDGIMHLEVGQPAFAAPRKVLEAAEKALKSDRLGYTEALGLSSLREKIAAHYRDKYGLSIKSERVLITTGSSAAFTAAFLSIFNEGDRVALPTPGYPAYRNILHGLGMTTVNLNAKVENRFMPIGPEILSLAAEDHGLKGLLLASPNNPSGTMVVGSRLKEIAESCDASGLWLVSDEIYHGLTYEGDEECALSYSENAIIINSFSKYYCMTGWRIGWMIVPECLVGPCEKILQNFFISPPTLSQIAAGEAFSCIEELEVRKSQYARNREILMEELPNLGLGNFMPMDGAFYVYVDVSKHTDNASVFATDALREAGVAMTPGIDFDLEHGSNHVRLSYAGKTEDIIEAMKRLKSWAPLA